MTTLVWPAAMVTGHRPKDLPEPVAGWVRGELARLVRKLRDEHGMTRGITGMALGVDQWWARALLAEARSLRRHGYR